MRGYIHVYVEEYEADVMFNTSLYVIGCWSCNDANWREKYFEGFMKNMGNYRIPLDELCEVDADMVKARALEYCKYLWGECY